MDELDELNEAPNIVRGEVNLQHNLHADDAAAMMAPPSAHRQRMLADDDDDEDDEDVVLSTDDLLRRGGMPFGVVPAHVPNAMVLVGAAAARSPQRQRPGVPQSNGDLGSHRMGAAGPHVHT